MKSLSVKTYCAQTYDDTKKSHRLFECFGSEQEIGNQRTNIRELIKKRNKYYRNDIDLKDVDDEIKQFQDDIKNRKTKALQQDDKMPLIKTEKCPDFLFDDPDECGSTVLCVGSSKRGKSLLLLKAWERYFKDEKDMITILISPSCNIPLFKSMKNVIKINRYDKQTDALLKKLFKLQNLTHNAYKFAFLIDDCVANSYTESLNFLFLVARNLMISTFCCVQRETLVSRSARSSANNIVTFGINTEQCIKGILESFFKTELKEISGLTKMDDLITEFRRLTSMGGGHSFLVYIPFTRQLKHYILEK
jgi:hypothetical protein